MVNVFPGVPAHCLCDKHLNATINESLNLLIRYHLKNGHKINGWVRNGCIDYRNIQSRISELLSEMTSRGKNWDYHFLDSDIWILEEYFGKWECTVSESEMMILAIAGNKSKLSNRCGRCRERIMKEMER